MKNLYVLNILYKWSDNDTSRTETRIKAGCPLINSFLFHRSACTVVLFTLFLAVTQRNLRRRCKSLHVSCYNTAMMGV